MSDVSFSLRHRITFTGKACHDGYSRRMKAEVSQPQPSQKLVPLLRRVFWQVNQTRTFLFLRAANERQQIIVKGSRVNASTFCEECDNALAQIDVAQRNRRFRNTAALTHRNQP